jgi:hypothetical protein
VVTPEPDPLGFVALDTGARLAVEVVEPFAEGFRLVGPVVAVGSGLVVVTAGGAAAVDVRVRADGVGGSDVPSDVSAAWVWI